MKKKTNCSLALSKETLRALGDRGLEAAAGGLTGTATLTCEGRTCGTCVTCFVTCYVTCKCP